MTIGAAQEHNSTLTLTRFVNWPPQLAGQSLHGMKSPHSKIGVKCVFAIYLIKETVECI